MQSRAQTVLLSPGPNITALRELFTELLDDQTNVRRISNLMSGADIRYDMRPDGPAHPLTGGWMPDLALSTENGPTRVADLMHAARPILLNLADRADLVEAASDWTDRVDVVTATSIDRPADAVLIRPDGYVAWATAPGAPGGANALRQALRTWFGLPIQALSPAGAGLQ
jgi:hypothetical protein